jgi:hypothetical protein
MNTALRIGVFASALAIACMLAVSSDAEGEKKAEIWKTFLPGDIYKELVKRDLAVIEKALGSADFKVADRAKVSAAMIVGHTMSLKDKVGNPEGVRAAAVQLQGLIDSKDKKAEAKKLIASILTFEGVAPARDEVLNFKELILDDDHLMLAFEMKDKGGDGIDPALQISKRLEGSQNGSENLFNFLARKAPKADDLGKAARELELLSYWTAVAGEVTLELKPKKKAEGDNGQVWEKTSIQMRDAAVELALAANRKDGEGVSQAALRLQDSCLACHRLYRIE